jgi:hypothetical protein
MNHELKTDPEVFDAVKSGAKTFEIRFDDRWFKVGDILTLRKTRYTGSEMQNGAPLEYTGDQLECKVTYILKGPKYGLSSGWVIMSIAILQKAEPVGEAEYMPGTTGFTMCCFKASDIPVGTKLYAGQPPAQEPTINQQLLSVAREMLDARGRVIEPETMARWREVVSGQPTGLRKPDEHEE